MTPPPVHIQSPCRVTLDSITCITTCMCSLPGVNGRRRTYMREHALTTCAHVTHGEMLQCSQCWFRVSPCTSVQALHKRLGRGMIYPVTTTSSSFQRRFQQASLYSRLSRDAGRQARAGCDLTLMRVHFLRDNLFYLHVRDDCRIQIHTI